MNKKIMAAALAAVMLASPTALADSDINIFVNGNYIDCSSYVIDDTTYIPLRAVSEALGADVGYDETTNTASITLGEDNSIPKMIEDVSQSVVAIVGNSNATDAYEGYGIGTGVVVKSNGHILTNYHVVENIKNITVIFSDGTGYPATVLYGDATADLAVIKISRLGLKPIQFADENSIAVGQTVFAIGTPLSLSYRNTATRGMISGIGVTVSDNYYSYIQSDAVINGGNSGGPLVNSEGKLVGINAIKNVSTGVEGMSFSIPVDTVKYALEQFETNGKIVRADINTVFEESWEAKIGLPTQKGLTVKSSASGVLLPGDAVTAVNGVEIHSKVDYNEALKKTFDGGNIVLTVERGSETLQLEAVPELK